jgi:thiol-disulfide isomerase/thioredoxin
VSLALFALGLSGSQTVQAQASQDPLIIYFFWGNGCPHCAQAEPFLADLEQRYPEVEVKAYEVWYDEGNQKIWADMMATFGKVPEAVPTIIIGDRIWKGYSTDLGTGKEIEAYVKTCLAEGCGTEGAATPEEAASPDKITLPLIGTVDLASQSLFVGTLLIAFIDGFNPCSLWVLSMLLAITRTRRCQPCSET